MTILRLPIFARVFNTINPNIREYVVNASPKIYCKKFTEHRYYTTTTKSPIDSQNIISSKLPDVTGFENIYLHDFIWEKIGRWWNHTAVVRKVILLHIII